MARKKPATQSPAPVEMTPDEFWASYQQHQSLLPPFPLPPAPFPGGWWPQFAQAIRDLAAVLGHPIVIGP